MLSASFGSSEARINYFEILMIINDIAGLMQEQKRKQFLKLMDKIIPRCSSEGEIQEHIAAFLKGHNTTTEFSITKPGVTF